MKKNNITGSGGKKRKGIDRRTFLKLSAYTGAVLGTGHLAAKFDSLAAAPIQGKNRPEEKWTVSSCLNCQARCAIRVRTVNGKAVKISGNPLSLVSEGAICPRGHIGLQVLYDPGRILTPLKRTNNQKDKGTDPKWVPISWEQALYEVVQHLKPLQEKARTHRLLVFSGLNARSSEDIISRFANAFGTPNLISGCGLELESEKSGNWMADGNYSHSAYDFDRTNYLLAFGADMLESSKPLSRFLRKWGRMRREKPNRTKIVAINPRYSLTAAKSDEWIPLQPGTDAALAMSMAHVIISEGLFDKVFVDRWTVGFDPYKQLALSRYSPDNVSKITGVPAETIRRIAREFATTKPAVALKGQEAVAWPEGSYTSYAISCLNALVGSIDAPGGLMYQEYPKYKEMPPPTMDQTARKGLMQPALDFRGTDRFPVARTVTNQIPESLLKGIPYPIEMAIGFNSNFNMSAPETERWEAALRKLPYYVHVSPFISEMAMQADLILPSTTYLEEWGYDHSPAGSGFAEIRIKQPVVQPLDKARSVTDIIFDLSRKLTGDIARSFSNIGDDSKGFARFRTQTLMSWKELVEKGVWKGKDYEFGKYGSIFDTPSGKFEFYSGNLKALLIKTGKRVEDGLVCLPHFEATRYLGEKDRFDLVLLPYQPLMVIENGSQNYPWAQEIFLPMHGIGWDTLVEINSKTAKQLKLRDGGIVWVESPFRKIKAKVKFSEGIHPQVVAMAGGQGHYAYGRWQKGIGVNPNDIIGTDYDRLSGQSVFFNTRVKVYKA